MPRFFFLVLVAIGSSYLPVGCNGDEHPHATGPTDAFYAGTATDEGLKAFEAATSTVDAARAPALTAPAAGAKVPSATPVAFTWKPTPTSLRLNEAPSKARYAGSSPFGSMHEAHAHGTPMSGKAYLLTIAEGGTTIFRAFTTNTTFQPDDATWAKVKGKSLTATLATASFDQNNVVPGSGPYAAPPVSFSVEP